MPVGRFLVGALVVWAASGISAWGQEETPSEPPAPVIDYWIGDLSYSGVFKQDATLALNGNTLNFGGPKSTPVNGQVQVKVWLADDGVPRLQTGSCVAALFPTQEGATFATGGVFSGDYSYAGSPARCGLADGETQEQWTNTLTPTPDGIRYDYMSVNKMANPKGKAKLTGQAMLRPVYKPIPKPAPPPRVMAATGAVAGMAKPEGQFALSEAVKYYGIERSLDVVLQLDSRAWLMNRYNVGSVVNGRFLKQTSGGLNDLLYGEYAFNGGRQGWLKVQLSGGDVQCIEYWDALGVCKAPGAMSVGAQMAIGAMMSSMMSPSGSSGSMLDDNEQFLNDQVGCKQWVC